MEEKSLIRKSVTYPFCLFATLWIIKFLEAYFKWNLFDLGIRPRIPEGLIALSLHHSFMQIMITCFQTRFPYLL